MGVILALAGIYEAHANVERLLIFRMQRKFSFTHWYWFNSLANVVDLLDVRRYDVLWFLEERVHDGGAAGQLARDARNTCNNG